MSMYDFEVKQIVRNIKLYILSNKDIELSDSEREICLSINKHFENVKAFISKDRERPDISSYKFYGESIQNIILEVEENFDIAYLKKNVHDDILIRLNGKYPYIRVLFFEYMKDIYGIKFSRLESDRQMVAYENGNEIIPTK